jgi:hypothetical protein
MPADDSPLWSLPRETPRGRPLVTCALCDEPLSASESRRWNLGPRCRRKLGLGSAPGVGRFEVPQETLPEV